MLIAESMKSLKKVLVEQLEGKGMRLNVKTKDMLSGRNCGITDKSAKWPCRMYGMVLEVSPFNALVVIDG